MNNLTLEDFEDEYIFNFDKYGGANNENSTDNSNNSSNDSTNNGDSQPDFSDDTPEGNEQPQFSDSEESDEEPLQQEDIEKITKGETIDPQVLKKPSSEGDEDEDEELDTEADIPSKSETPENDDDTNKKTLSQEELKQLQSDNESDDEEDYIIDDEEFTLDESEKEIIIIEKESIPENKVIVNNKEQELDLFNELVRLLPESKRDNKFLLNRISKIMKNCSNLRYNYSYFNENHEPIKPKFKTNNFKPLLEKYLNSNFDNKTFIPLISCSKDVYLVEGKEDEYIPNIDLITEELDDYSNVIRNDDKIKQQLKIRLKYKKMDSRVNYSYSNELNETYKSMNIYNNYKNNGYLIDPENDIEVLRDCINNKCVSFTKEGYNDIPYESIKILGKTQFDDNIIESEKSLLTGFLKFSNNNFKNNYLNYNTAPLIKNTNKKYSYNNYKSIVDANITNVNMNYTIGDNIELCYYINSKLTKIKGAIVDIEENKYIIKPTDKFDKEKYNLLEIPFDDENIIISKDIENCDSLDDLLVYQLPSHEISNDEYKLLLNNIIPNNKKIISENIKEINKCISLDDISEIIESFDLSIDDLTEETFIPIKKSLNKNIQKLIKTSISEYKKYQSLKTSTKNEKRNNISLINNKLINSVSEYYGNYPFDKLSIDSNTERYKWLKNSFDKGALFNKIIVLNIVKSIYSNPAIEKIKDGLASSIQKIISEINSLDIEIERLKADNLLKKEPKCPSYKVVKIYHSLQDLEYDNNKEVEIDSDRIIYNSDEKLVKPNDYCILKLSETSRKLYKRIELETGQIWVLEFEKNIDDILEKNEHFCFQKSKNLEDIDNIINSDCALDEETNNCEFIDIIRLKNKKIDKEYQRDSKENNLKELQNGEELIKNLEEYVNSLKQDALLNKDLVRKQYEYNMQKFNKVTNDIDEENQELYKKIDLYLEKINKLSDEKMYPLLEVLYNKYGRNKESENENPLNIYCKIGKKILFCKHHMLMMDFYKMKNKSNEIYEELIETYSIENDGKFWCKNCGQELYISGFETIEGFEESGARMITTEELVEDDDAEIMKTENSEMFETLKQYLNEEEMKKIESDESHLNIMKVIRVIVKLMGIDLNMQDEMTVYKNSNFILKSVIKSQTEWVSAQKKLPKSKSSIETLYNSYRLKYTILYTVSHLFIVLQYSIPEYVPTKSHSKCKLSLKGYPLDIDNTNVSGLEYISCLLENLRQGTSSWSCLKKLKIKEALKKIISQLIGDDFISKKLIEKRQYLKTESLKEKKTEKLIWDEFKPPLNKIKISIDLEKETSELLLSLKKIELIDNHIDSQRVENILYDPAPLGNSCCIDTINNEYNYINYFKDQIPIEKIDNLLIKYTSQQKSNRSTIILDYETKKSDFDIQSFNKNIYPTEISDNEIKNMYDIFISSGRFLGKTHIYDENNICVMTGQTRKSILDKEYTLDDYNELVTNINRSNLFSINTNSIEISNCIQIFDTIFKHNNILKNDPYLQKSYTLFVEKISSKNIQDIEKLWTDFEEQTKVETDELIDIISTEFKSLDAEKLREIIEFLKNIGEFKNILEENKELYGDNISEKIYYNKKSTLIVQYLKNYLLNGLKKINNNKYYDQDNITPYTIPKVWKLDDSYTNKLTQLLISDSKYIKKINLDNTNISDLIDITNRCISKIEKIVGKNHVYNQDGTVKYFSDITYKNASILLHYIFIITMKKLITSYKLESSDIVSANVDFVNEPGLELDEVEEDESLESLEKNNLSKDLDIDMDMDNIYKKRVELTKNIFISLLDNMITKNNFEKKYSRKYIDEVIEKKRDTQKEDNLKFIEELSKEARYSFKAMIAIGIDTWKNMTNKDKSLYFDKPITEDTELTLEEVNMRNRNLAEQELGDRFNEEAYQDWLSRRHRNDNEDRQAHIDRDILEDDDE